MLERKNNWGKNKYWRREIIIFGHYAPFEEKVQTNDNFYNQLQTMLNKNKKVITSYSLEAWTV
jgi:hypothetical protein